MLVRFMGSEYPIDVRISASSKLIISLKKLPEAKKTLVTDILLTKLSTSADSWEQRNIVEVLSCCLNTFQCRKLKSILNGGNPHIDPRVRVLGLSIIEKVGWDNT